MAFAPNGAFQQDFSRLADFLQPGLQ